METVANNCFDNTVKHKKLRNVYLAQYYYSGGIAKREAHWKRNEFNLYPVFELKKMPDGRYRDCITDSFWIKEPWYRSIFHQPWKNYKFICYDSDVMDGASGTSEIIVPKRAANKFSFDVSNVKAGSYNYRAKGFPHFCADILPNVIYCRRVGG